jgi:ketosteroid isomerase-like protein
MKEPIAVLAATLAFVVCGIAQSKNAAAASEASTKEKILQIERERNQAIISGDAAALDRMTSDDYTFITLRGELRTKAEITQGFTSGSFHYDSRQISEVDVRVYGSTAVVTGRSTQKGQENGKDYSGDYRFTPVYSKQSGRWVTVALQTTLIQHSVEPAGLAAECRIPANIPPSAEGANTPNDESAPHPDAAAALPESAPECGCYSRRQNRFAQIDRPRYRPES